jgi:uncharacterized protein
LSYTPIESDVGSDFTRAQYGWQGRSGNSMRLEFAGAPEISSSPDRVWDRLVDPRFVALSAPGVESVEVIDTTHFRVTSGFGMNSIKARVTILGEMFDLVPGISAKMQLRGQGAGSTITVLSSVIVQDLGAGRVRLQWSATSELGGSIASVGGRLLEGVARTLTEQFWADFARRVAEEKG